MNNWKKALAVLLMAGTLMATETRVATMGGDIDLLINDEQNVLIYPSTLIGFRNLVTLEFGTLPSWGMGSYPAGILITRKDKIAIGVLGNRPIYWTNHPTDPLQVNAYGLVFGMEMGNLNIGAQLNMGLRQFSNTPAANTTYSHRALFLGIVPGITFRNGNMGVDASLDLTVQSWKDEGYNSTTDTLKFAGTPVIGGNFRFSTGTRRKKIIAALHADYFKDAYEQNNTTFNNGTTVAIDAKVGQQVRPIKDVKIVGGLNVNFTNLSTSDTSGTTTINSGFVLGGESKVLSKLGFRAGVTRNIFTYNKTKNGAVSTSNMGFASAPLNVSLGAFLSFKKVRIDASISHDLLFNGPYLLTGVPSRFTGTASLIANF